MRAIRDVCGALLAIPACFGLMLFGMILSAIPIAIAIWLVFWFLG